MNETRAVIGMPQIAAIPSASDSASTVYSIVLAVGLGLFGIWKIAGKVSRDKVSMDEDGALRATIKTLQDERDKYMAAAEEAWSRRTEDAAEIAKLTATNQHLSQTVTQLAEDVKKLRDEVHRLRNELAKRPVQT